ncbi:MAG: hypothetical protein WBH45_01935 [Acidobacteriaceae bacterium]
MRTTIKIILALAVVLAPGAVPAETCILQTYASSWMATGTPFSVKCPSGIYSGHLISTPARRFFRRGHLMLVFDQPVGLIPKKEGDEGKIQSGRGRQVANMLVDGGVGIGTKDLTDGLSGAIFKSWYMIPVSAVTLAFFSNGGDVLLKPGYELHIESRSEQRPENSPSHRLSGAP